MESLMKDQNTEGWFAPYAAIRTDCYVMLASLLGQAPSEAMIGILQNLHWDDAIPGKLNRSLDKLRQAACWSTAPRSRLNSTGSSWAWDAARWCPMHRGTGTG